MPNWKDWRWWGKGRPPCRCPSSSPTPPQQAEAFGFILQVATYGVGGWLAPHFDTYRLPGEEVRHGRWNHHHRHHNHPDHQPPSEARWGQRGMGWHSDGISHLSRAGRTHCLSKVRHCDISMLKKVDFSKYWYLHQYFTLVAWGRTVFLGYEYCSVTIYHHHHNYHHNITENPRLGLKVAPVAGSLLVWQTIGSGGQVTLSGCCHF